MADSVNYTEPLLCTYDEDLSKEWFIYFSITNEITNVTIRKQFRGGINKHKNVKDRLTDGKALAAFWKQQLKEGWNPFNTASDIERLGQESFIKALAFALDECKSEVSTATYRAYDGAVEKITAAANSTSIKNIPITHIKRAHIKQVLKIARQNFKWTNKRYNNMLSYLCAVLGRLVQWDVLEYNPAEKIKLLPVTETQKFIPYTAEEKEKIREYFYLNHYTYFVILMITYHTGIRPKEVLALKIKHINLQNRTIYVLPEIELENSKTKKIREAPINNELFPFLRELNLQEYNSEYYVFGSPYQKGKGNRGSAKGGLSGVMHPDYFKPAMTMIKRDTITRFWKKIVKDKLGINKYQYAMKHTGADDKILAGVSLDALRKMYGHYSKQMTETYAQKIIDVYREEIISLSPKF